MEEELKEITEEELKKHDKELEDFNLESLSKYENELLNYQNTPLIRIYINDIRQYPFLSKEQTDMLALEMKNGNLQAREILITSNLGLVIWTIKMMKPRLPEIVHYKMMDLIQEGNAALIKAIDNYDFEKGSVSTYAKIIIEREIKQALLRRELEIHRPRRIIKYAPKYLELINGYLKVDKPIPSDRKVCKILNITQDTLDRIRTHLEIDMTSLETAIGKEGESKIIDIIPDKNAINAEDNLTNLEYILSIKFILENEPIDYFVIYHRYLSNIQLKQEEIANLLGLRHQRIEQIETRAKRRLRRINLPNNEFSNISERYIRQKEGSRFYNLKVEPINTTNVIIYSYIKESLTDKERCLLDLLIFGKYNYSYEELSKELKISINAIHELERSIQSKTRDYLIDRNSFLLYKQEILSKMKSKILLISSVDELSLENKRKLAIS